MIDHIIWIAGLAGHLGLIAVLFFKRRAQHLPWFTLLIIFYVVRSVGLVLALRLQGHPAPPTITVMLDGVDVFLQCAVLVELSRNILRPLGGRHRLTLPLLMVISAAILTVRIAPPGQHRLAQVLVLAHFGLSLLMVEWTLVVALLMRALRRSWLDHAVAISLGFGFYSAVLLAGGGYFTTGREMRDYVVFSYARVAAYLLAVIFWMISLWHEDPRAGAALS